MKWLYSTLAFILVTVFVSGLTTHVFIREVNSGFEDAKNSLPQKAGVYANQSLDVFYTQFTDAQKLQVNQIEALTPSQRKEVLGDQCLRQDFKDSPFCNPRFISGQINFNESLKENTEKQFIEAQTQALNQVNEKLTGYGKYPLILISVIAGILSLIFYYLTNKSLFGIQTFAGNAAWLGLLSAVSYYFMPNILDKLVSTLSGAQGAEAQLVNITKEIMFTWLTKAMDSAFVASLWISGLTFILWLALKLYRKYTFSVEKY